MDDDRSKDRELPRWDSAEMRRLYPNEETRGVYRVLYETRDDPLPMMDVRARVAKIFGRANTQTDRRARDLRTHFVIKAERTPGTRNEFTYRLVGWRHDAATRTARGRLSPKVEAAIYSDYGGRCAWCGRCSKEDGVRVVIDHKIPLDLGGSNDPGNLQLLCEEHNHGKQAMFAEFEDSAPAVKQAIGLDEPQLRIGELLKALPGQPVRVDLINLVAREENRGDPTKRLRELRALGWIIDSSRRKEGKRHMSYYTLRHWEPWPPGGPRKAINALEAERKRRKRAQGNDSGGPS